VVRGARRYPACVPRLEGRLERVEENSMRPETFHWSCLSRSKAAWFAALVFVTVGPAQAQVTCKLLQSAELESTLKEWASGGKATAFSGATDDSSGISFDTCGSEIVRPGQGNLQISVVFAQNLPMKGEDAIRTRNAALAREEQWKGTGAQFEEKTVGKAMCTHYGRPSVPAHAVCAIPRGKAYVEVEVIAPSLKEVASMDAVAALVQMANGRL
jgi:hypothetical protein